MYRPCAARLSLTFGLATMLSAQCTPHWVAAPGLRGADNYIEAMTMWDPDGAGPTPPRLVIGGRFRSAGTVVTDGVAAWDPVTGQWSALGGGLTIGPGTTATVRAITTLPNGDLVICGYFATVGGVPANGVARWNGTNWSAMGAGVSGGYSLATLPNGDVVIGGYFETAGGVPANGVARWDGTSWLPLGSGLLHTLVLPPTPNVMALKTLANGDLVAAGQFNQAGGVAVENIARWDGTSWSPIGPGVGRVVQSLAVLPNGDLVAGGSFSVAGGAMANGVTRWDGTAWQQLGSGLTGASFPTADSMAVLPGGDLVVGGSFSNAGGVGVANVARWNGTAWSPVSIGVNGGINALAVLPGGQLAAGGGFTAADSVNQHVDNMAVWNGVAWGPPAMGVPETAVRGEIFAITALPGGGLVAGGTFTDAGGVAASNIAHWNGTSWSAMGSGLDGAVLALVTMPDGAVVAGGQFANAGGVAANRIARWDGTSWSPLGSGLGGVSGVGVNALALAPNGDLIATGSFSTAGGAPANNIARWNGTAWSPIGAGLPNTGNAVAVLPGGHIVASHVTNPIGAFLSRWDGVAWAPFAPALGNVLVRSLLVLPDGDLVAGGNFSALTGSNIARHQGGTWLPLGSGTDQPVTSLARLPNGDLVAGGFFFNAGGQPANRIARWNGAAWAPIEQGFNDAVFALAMTADGELAAGGRFTAVNSDVSLRFARFVSPCPASALAYGSGCATAGGTMHLTATALPGLGVEMRSRSNGFGPNSFGLWVLGLTQVSIPLQSLIPAAGAGCSLLSSAEILTVFVVPGGGAGEAGAFVPVDPYLIGVTLFNQMGQVEVGPSLDIVHVGSSNGLVMTIGVL